MQVSTGSLQWSIGSTPQLSLGSLFWARNFQKPSCMQSLQRMRHPINEPTNQSSIHSVCQSVGIAKISVMNKCMDACHPAQGCDVKFGQTLIVWQDGICMTSNDSALHDAPAHHSKKGIPEPCICAAQSLTFEGPGNSSPMRFSTE